MGRLVKLVGTSIGLASEAIASRKSSSQVPTQSSQASSSRSPPPINDDSPPQYVEVPDARAEELIASGRAVPADSKSAHDSDGTSEEGDEEQWELDEALETTQTSTDANEPDLSEAQVTDAFLRSHQPPAYSERRGTLPCPVILPQRRPRDKRRGFVRAYAPVLQDCGIDQAAFLDFLKSFHAASKASPYLSVVNIAAAIAGMAPSVIAMGVSIGVQVAVGIAMELQSRARSTSFLDRVNKEFFQPRGLYCLIMTYKPESSSTHERVDIMQTIQSSLNPADSGMKAKFSKLKISSGKTYGELEMPEAAPLIFPALEELAADNSEEGVKKQNKLKSSQKFVMNYMDKRAQAKFAAENPESSLAAAPPASFASRYSDPNHPANSGSLISLVTGGAVNPEALRENMRVRRAVRRGEEVTWKTRQKRGGKGLVKRMLQKDVLYMMIVNLPSEEELAPGRKVIAEEEMQR